MKLRFVFAIAIGLIGLLALISLIFSQVIQPFLPANINNTVLIFIAATGGAMVFLALIKDIIELAEKLFGNTKFGINKYDVYISNSHTDQQFVEVIVDKLRIKGVKVWLTEQQLQPGKALEEELRNAMKRSKSAAFLVGQRGVTNWQEKELNWAVGNNIHIIPVLLPGIPFSILASHSSLHDRYAIQFSSSNDDQAMINLLHGIKGEK